MRPIYINGTSWTQGMIFQLTTGSSAFGYEFIINNDGSIYCGYSGIGYFKATNPNVVTYGSWHYIALTFSGSTNNLYVNGVIPGLVTNSALMSFSSTFMSIAGCHNGAYSYKGYLDDFRVYNRVLSLAEIQLYASK
jgi:hypothetical protein